MLRSPRPRAPHGLLLVALSFFALLALRPAANAEDRPKLDAEIPFFPVDAAACARFLKGGTASIDEDPYAIPGVTAEHGMQITGALVPNSPIFHFYASFQNTLYFSPVSFHPGLRCFINASLSDDGKLHYYHVPDGEYLIFTYTAYNVAYSGTSSNTSTGFSPFGPVFVTTNTPYSGQYVRSRVYGATVTVKDNKVSGNTPTELSGSGR